jgi:Fe-S-cluster containining protein
VKPDAVVNQSDGFRNLRKNYQHMASLGIITPLQGQSMDVNLIGYFQYSKEIIEKVPAGPKRAEMIHEKVNHEIKMFDQTSAQAKQISCGKGCAACCHIRVGITQDEAKLLAARVKLDTPIDMERLREIAAWPDTFESYRDNYPKGRCVFLGFDNACKVYDDRPSVCRTYRVVSDPADCVPDKPKNVKALAVAGAEAVVTAQLTVGPEGSLSRMLLKELESSV